MRSVLGIDAAWTYHNDSGVALVVEQPSGRWRSITVAGSYSDFLASAGMLLPSDFTKVPAALVQACNVLTGGASLVLVAADIPLSRSPITGRRIADNIVSREFGARGCSTHSPSVTRPGPISTALRDGFAAAGFPLAASSITTSAALIETYPHPALLTLMNAERRVAYKLARANKEVPIESRWREFTKTFRDIVTELGKVIDGVETHFLWPDERVPLSRLKPIEDTIDALVCAWVAIQILQCNGRSLGDDHDVAAIWLPKV